MSRRDDISWHGRLSCDTASLCGRHSRGVRIANSSSISSRASRKQLVAMTHVALDRYLSHLVSEGVHEVDE
jgi:hypothetical protein